jgi:hypothetical protein
MRGRGGFYARYRTEDRLAVVQLLQPITPERKAVRCERRLKVSQQVLAKVSAESPDPAAPAESALSAADIAHSEENILQWMQYLPTDCVKAMIRMGWDLTT